MKIQRVYITGFRGDVRFTRCAVASVRRWYPEIPITLIKDLGPGDYDTSDIERHWRVDIYQSDRTRFGTAGKLELLFAPPGERFLAIDSDIVFLGRVLDVLDEFPEDFVVNGWKGRENVQAHFYDVERLRELAPGFTGDERAFNAGQFVAKSGLLRRQDFDGVVDFTEPPRLFRPDIFRHVDQGPLNLVVLQKHKLGELTVRWHSYMWSAGEPALPARMRARSIDPAEGYPMLVHWAGFTTRGWRRLPLSAVLDHYERLFYAGIPHGTRKRLHMVASEYRDEILARPLLSRMSAAGRGARRLPRRLARGVRRRLGRFLG